MKKKRRNKLNYNKIIGLLLIILLLIFIIIKFNNMDSTNINYFNNSEENIIEINNNNNNDNINNNKHESKAIPLSNGEKSTNTLPVLMYHYFYDDSNGEESPDSNYMPISSFNEQLKYLSENDFYYPTWEEVADFVDGKVDLPDKSIVITMDDGDESVFTLAYPLLEKYNVKATAFIITNNFNENDYKKYENTVLDLQSHTDNMHRGGGSIGHGGIFPALSLEDGTNDLKNSIKKLGGNSGALAYPFGDCTESTKIAAKNAGFKVAFTTINGSVKPGMDKYELPRLRIFSDISLAGFKYYAE